MFNSTRYLLLQIRNPDDPMRSQEVQCFTRALRCDRQQIKTLDLLSSVPSQSQIDRADILLLGGSGDYSATSDQPWLLPVLESLRMIHDQAKPTFASCWGFQAFARAMDGEVVNDPDRAEVGTHHVNLTEDGLRDPLFGPLGDSLYGQMGHQDRVSKLPAEATLLASTPLVENQAYRFKDKPIYCTQFHAELNRNDLLGRVRAYPEYIENVSGMTLEQFEASCFDTPETEALLPRFVKMVLES